VGLGWRCVVQGTAGTAEFLAGASAELDAAFSKIERSFLVNHGHAQPHSTATPTPPPHASNINQKSITMKVDPRMDLTDLLSDEEVSFGAKAVRCV